MRTRSMLFGPAERTDFVPKFVKAGADIGVLDLEDATPETHKSTARDVLVDAGLDQHELGSMLLLVRTNDVSTAHFAEDVRAAADCGASGLVVPKLESAAHVAEVRAHMDRVGLPNAVLCAGIESALGVHHCVEVAGAGANMAYFGAEDFITDVGGVRTESNNEVLYARSQVALAARLGEIPVLDQVVVDYADDARFVAEAEQARALGYAGKLCIHPNQVTLANAAFSPSEDEVSWARGVVAAAEEAERDGLGVVSYEGTMVDAPIVVRAKALLAGLADD